MKLFSRKQQQPQPIIPPELQPYYNMQSHQKSMWRSRQVLLPVVVLLLALIVVGIVVWQIIAQTTSHDALKRSPASTQSPQSNSATENKNGTPARTPSSDKTNTAPVSSPAE
jgi:zona occludens toxin (predicted ATPase)